MSPSFIVLPFDLIVSKEKTILFDSFWLSLLVWGICEAWDVFIHVSRITLQWYKLMNSSGGRFPKINIETSAVLLLKCVWWKYGRVLNQWYVNFCFFCFCFALVWMKTTEKEFVMFHITHTHYKLNTRLDTYRYMYL